MNNSSTALVCEITRLCETIQVLFTKFYAISAPFSQRIVDSHLKPLADSLKKDLWVYIEYPYVDKMYRDAYYNYYSSKLSDYHRNCIRLSFFSGEIRYEDFRDFANKEKLSDMYRGFVVLRPTFPKIIGRSGLSPKAKLNDQFACCLAKINATAGSLKFKVEAYPSASQENQTITCAETTIWALQEYFGNKFPDQKPVLPSAITRLLHKFSYKRQVPSDGLTAEQVTYAVRELGFGAVIYSRKKYEDDFHAIINMYIESGIPVIGVLQNADATLGHAVNIVGRELTDVEKIVHSPVVSLGARVKIIDYNNIPRKYVLVDDNHPPYQLTNIDGPCKGLYADKKWENCEFSSIIVPLHSRIYLEALRARKNFLKALESAKLGVRDAEPRVVKVFLCSSRSYKEYLSLNRDLDIRTKELILNVSMPKFIWVAEVSKLNSVKSSKCDGFLIQDATEPLEYSDKTMLSHLSLTGYMDGIVFRQEFGRFAEFRTFAASFENYQDNLK